MKITFSKINKIAQDVLKEKYDQISEESIKEEMRSIIDRQENKLILESLGLENGWEGISLRYDGSFRKNLKILSDENLSKIAQGILKEIFENTIIELSEAQKAHLRKMYRDVYMEVAEDRISELAKENADGNVAEMFREFVEKETEE